MSNYYAIVYSGNSLSHYGVPGMKWGVRRDKYEAKAREFESKQANAKSRFMQNRYNRKAVDYREKARTAQNMANAKTFGEKYSARMGYKRNASLYKAVAERNSYLSKNAKTKFGRARASAMAYNAKSASGIFERASAKKGIVNKFASAYSGLNTRTIETTGGRHMNAGQYNAHIMLAQVGNLVVPGSGLAYMVYQDMKGYKTNRS